MKEYGSQPPWGDTSDRDAKLESVDQIDEAKREIARLEAKLEDEHALLESALEHLPNGILICDTDGRFVYHNPAAEEIWGGFEDADTIEDWAEYSGYYPDGRAFDPEDWGMARALKNDEVVEPRAIEVERFDGEEAVILGCASPFYGPDGEVRGSIAVFSDITELKQLEEAQRKARATAERAASRMTDLQAVTTALFDALTPQKAVRVAMDRACDLLEADRGVGMLVDEDREAMEVVAECGYDSALDEFRHIDIERPYPAAEAVRLHTGIFISDPDEYERRYPHLKNRSDLNSAAAFAVVPLIVDGRAVGTLSVTYREPRIFDEHDRAFLQALAGQCAQAVRRAQLYQDEQRARAEAERAHRRQRFLAEASTVLNSSLEYDQTLEQVANLAVPDLADWCVVDLAGPDHSLAHPVAIAHTDPDKVEWAYQYRRNHPPTPESGGAAAVLETGESILHREISDQLLRARAHDDEHLKYLQTIGMTSIMVAPMIVRDRVLGAVTFASAREDRHFDDSDLETAEELARRAAMALDNAELHRDSERARQRLSQRAEQQHAVSRLARHALDADLEDLFDEALETLVDLLDADTAKLMELREDSTLVLRAGIGWRDEWMGVNLGPPDESTAIGYALLENEVVVVEDLSDAERGPTELVTAHDLESAMTVQVPGRVRPFGAIGVHSRRPRTFTVEDSEFIRGISNVLSDAIEKERAERQREATYRRLAEAMRDREELLSVVSHDLRSPASAVQMNLEVIRRHLDSDQPSEDAIRESIESAESSIDRMVEMMSDLLEVASGDDERQGGVQIEHVDFGNVVRDVTAEFGHELDETGSALDLQIESDLRGRTDRVRLEQIVGNLVSNAIKYGDGEPIEVAVTGDDAEVELRIRDHGVGIPPEHQDQIFERFHRIEEERDEDSFGLGLWIVKRSVETLGGTIDFVTEPGKGTEFRVRLPREPKDR